MDVQSPDLVVQSSPHTSGRYWNWRTDDWSALSGQHKAAPCYLKLLARPSRGPPFAFALPRPTVSCFDGCGLPAQLLAALQRVFLSVCLLRCLSIVRQERRMLTVSLLAPALACSRKSFAPRFGAPAGPHAETRDGRSVSLRSQRERWPSALTILCDTYGNTVGPRHARDISRVMVAFISFLACAVVFKLMTTTNAVPQRHSEVLESDVDFSRPGPCSTSSWQTTLKLPPDLQATLTNTLKLSITYPSASQRLQPPFPVLVWFNGFQARASQYHLLTERASSWGYVTVQYDTPLLRIFTVAAELRAFEPLVDWLAGQNDSPSSPLHGLLDLGHLTVGGHSRGGKLATLLYAANPSIKAAFLADPVDCTQFAPESPQNPSATKALAASGRRVGLAGAGVITSCNPEGGNYKGFWAAAAPGSWLGVLPGAAHAQFLDGGWLLNRAFDALCGRGAASRSDVAQLTATPMLAWFFRELEQVPGGGGAQPQPPALAAFFRWVKEQEAAGKLLFSVKDDSEAKSQAAGPQLQLAGASGGRSSAQMR